MGVRTRVVGMIAMAIGMGMTAGCATTAGESAASSTSAAPTSPNVTVNLLLVACDASAEATSDELRVLEQYAVLPDESAPRRSAESLEQVQQVAYRLVADGVACAMARPLLKMRDGMVGAVGLGGKTPDSQLRIEVRPSILEAGIVEVDVDVSFVGDNPDNRWEQLHYGAGGLRFGRAELHVPSGAVQGAALELVSGRPLAPADPLVMVFVTASAQ